MFQSQFRFDNECNINLPDNHKRVSESNETNETSMALTASDARSVSIFIFFYLFISMAPNFFVFFFCSFGAESQIVRSAAPNAKLVRFYAGIDTKNPVRNKLRLFCRSGRELSRIKPQVNQERYGISGT